jgi:fructokinase
MVRKDIVWPMQLGGLEAGGTKFICAVGSGPEDLRARVRIPTTTPAETVSRVVEYFREASRESPLGGVGIASFGPVDLDPASETYGYITVPPKKGWGYVDMVGPVADALGVPVAFDTDVNGAALAEHRWGAARGLDTFVYLTIGTGVGGGAIVNGRPLHGLLHPEMGHLSLTRHEGDDFPGTCPFHGTCFEGLASGTALEQRWGQRAETLPVDHPAWELEAYYRAQGTADLVCTLSPQRVILGGGVMSQKQLFPLVREEVRTALNDYVQTPEILLDNEDYIVPPGLGDRAGVLGAIALAESVAGDSR